MRRLLTAALLTLSVAATTAGLPGVAAAGPAAKPATTVKVRLTTTDGDLVLELDRAKAPLSVANFLQYVRDGHYDGTLFHRVIPGFVIQGGGYDAKFSERPTRAPVKNEAKNGLSNLRGTIAMARTADPDSATSQFYLNLADSNVRLDTLGGGYTVFGRVVEGLEVMDKIAAIPTGPGGPFPRDVPFRNALVVKAEVLEPAPKPAPKSGKATTQGGA
jgi:cyclophilin family peptidyl-prolyl cis-trans isomerase